MWYRVKVKYKVQNARGKWKAHNEEYLMNGISYGDIEAQLVSVTENRITDYKHTIREASFHDVYEPHVAGAFFSVTVEEEYFKKGELKKRNFKQLVVADSVSDAQDRAAAYMKNWTMDTKVIGADVTAIVGIWHPHVSAWQDDFKSRAADGFERGKVNADPNQLSAFDTDGSAKQEADEPAAPSDGPTPPTGKGKKGKTGIIYHISNEPVDA